MPIDERETSRHVREVFFDRQFWVAVGISFPALWLTGLLYGLPEISLAGKGVWFWALFLLISPVIEEAVFRGLIQGELEHFAFMRISRLGVSWSNVVASILFAAAHLFHQSMLWAMLTFFPSILFGHFFSRYGNRLFPSILLHITYNSLLLFVAFIT